MGSSKKLPIYRNTKYLQSLHGSLIFLTNLFLVLEGVSGPLPIGAGYWYMTITYGSKHSSNSDKINRRDNDSASLNGQSWNIGAFGACPVGDKCVPAGPLPPHADNIKSALIYHIIAAILFTIPAFINLYMIIYKPRNSEGEKKAIMYTVWTRFLPVLAWIPVPFALVADMAVREGVKGADDVTSFTLNGSFWLSTMAVITSSIYGLVAIWMRRVYKQNREEVQRYKEEKRRRQRRTVVQVAGHEKSWKNWLSPFGRTAKPAEEEKE